MHGNALKDQHITIKWSNLVGRGASAAHMEQQMQSQDSVCQRNESHWAKAPTGDRPNGNETSSLDLNEWTCWRLPLGRHSNGAGDRHLKGPKVFLVLPAIITTACSFWWCHWMPSLNNDPLHGSITARGTIFCSSGSLKCSNVCLMFLNQQLNLIISYFHNTN